MRAHQDHIGLGIIVGPGAAIGEVAAAEEVERGKAIDMDRLSKEVHIVDEIARIAQNELVLALPWRAIIARAAAKSGGVSARHTKSIPSKSSKCAGSKPSSS